MFLVLTFHWYIIPNAKHIRIQDSLQTIDFCSTNAGSDESVNSNINYEKVKRELHSLLSFVVWYFTECDCGTYEYDCLHNCSGHCLNDSPCDKQTGHCYRGCEPG